VAQINDGTFLFKKKLIETVMSFVRPEEFDQQLTLIRKEILNDPMYEVDADKLSY
jgi:hypothetical protein